MVQYAQMQNISQVIYGQAANVLSKLFWYVPPIGDAQFVDLNLRILSEVMFKHNILKSAFVF